MALALIDGCEDLSSWVTAGTPTPSAGAGRNANAASLSGSGAITFNIPTAQQFDTVTFGAALYHPAATVSADFLRFLSDSGVTVHTTLRLQTDGSLSVLRGTINTLGASAASTIPANTWYYLEVQCKLADSGGFITVRLNGTSIITVSSADTKNAGTKTVYDTVSFRSLTGVPSLLVDDLYLMSGSGDSFLGDITVETLYPNGDGAANQWLGSDGNSVANWQQVDEVPASSSDYNASATVGQVDEYALTDVTKSGTIVGLCHQSTMGLAAAGSQTFALVNRRTADTVGATQTCSSTTYSGFHQAHATDPETSAAWTVTNVNALQTGVKVI